MHVYRVGVNYIIFINNKIGIKFETGVLNSWSLENKKHYESYKYEIFDDTTHSVNNFNISWYCLQRLPKVDD